MNTAAVGAKTQTRSGDLQPDAAAAAVARLGHLGAPSEAWAETAWGALQGWLAEDKLEVQQAEHGGCRYLLVKVAAARPAFADGHPQALLISARLEPECVRSNSGCTAHGIGIARGGWLAVQAIAAARALHEKQASGGCVAGRDLIVSVEVDARHLKHADDLAEQPVLEALSCSAFALAEWGGWPLETGKRRAVPIAVAQKGRLVVRLRSRAESQNPALAIGANAIDGLHAALAAVAAMPRPWRKTAAAKAFVSAMAELSGLGKGLAWRALLGGGTWQRTMARFPRANRGLLDALFHDTVTPLSVSATEVYGGTPVVAEATLDCRLLPGADQAQFLSRLRASVGEDVEVEVLRSRPAVTAPLHTPLVRQLMQSIERHDPTSQAVPILMPGTSDALGWRQAAVPCYGFSPLQLPADQDALRLWDTGLLAPDDAQLRWGAEVMIDVVERFCVTG